MSEMDTNLRAYLDDLVPLRSDSGDWSAVDRVVRVTRRRRRLAAIVALAAALGALVATPAFGVRGALLHLLGADRFPRPADVEGEPVATGPHIILATGRMGEQQWKLVANESDQGLCVHLELIAPQRARSGGCGTTLSKQGVGLFTSSLASGATWIFGPVSRRATTVEIRLADGRSVPARIVAGRGFGTNFYLAMRTMPITLTAVVARGATGSVVGRQDVD